LEDLEHADLVFLIGGNPASNHPRLMGSLMQLRRRGGRVIVINPIREPGLERFHVPSDPLSLLFGSDIASQFVQPHIGGDLALLYGVAKRIVEIGAHDEEFLNQFCNEWDILKIRLSELSWNTLLEGSGVSMEEVNSIAEAYSSSKKTIFAWTMGITHHKNGVENVQAIANLALLRGMVGSPGCGLMPIRGHSNVQGVGSVGVTPRLKDAVFANLEHRFGVKLPTKVGKDTMACVEAAATGDLTTGFCLGGNLYGSNPDLNFVADAIGKLDQVVYVSTTLNTGHVRALARDTIILPVLARDEEPQPTTQESMFNFVRYSDGGHARHVGPRREIDVIASIASRTFSMLGKSESPIDWSSLTDNQTIRETIADVVPGFEAMGTIDESKAEFQIGGRTFHEPVFPTPDGKANLHVHEIPGLRQESEDSIRLMTIRSEGQFNTVVYEDEDLYRGVRSRDVILMHPTDLTRMSLRDGDRVTVSGPAGRMTRIRSTAFDLIKPGNAAMYFPEANVLVDRTVDPRSRTPVFKNIRVTVVRTDSHMHSSSV
ncbi:MAG: molybdopterin-dependent oxidoreductase, partial [Rhodothermales bacterium]|nr:molybdopterin-dependent oxidoreductase [Rhodothermales bacterium]